MYSCLEGYSGFIFKLKLFRHKRIQPEILIHIGLWETYQLINKKERQGEMEGEKKVILATDVRLVIVLFAYLQNCATFFFFFRYAGKQETIIGLELFLIFPLTLELKRPYRKCLIPVCFIVQQFLWIRRAVCQQRIEEGRGGERQEEAEGRMEQRSGEDFLTQEKNPVQSAQTALAAAPGRPWSQVLGFPLAHRSPLSPSTEKSGIRFSIAKNVVSIL